MRKARREVSSGEISHVLFVRVFLFRICNSSEWELIVLER